MGSHSSVQRLATVQSPTLVTSLTLILMAVSLPTKVFTSSSLTAPESSFVSPEPAAQVLQFACTSRSISDAKTYGQDAQDFLKPDIQFSTDLLKFQEHIGRTDLMSRRRSSKHVHWFGRVMELRK